MILEPPHTPDALTRLQIYNADGTPAEACGNGTRCVSWLLRHQRHTDPIVLETPTGVMTGIWNPSSQDITLSLGTPTWIDRQPVDLSAYGLPQGFRVSIGNPHLVILTPAIDAIPLSTLGPLCEHMWPGKTNVEFVEPTSEGLRMRVWERGVGETQACGTGAAAAAFVLIEQGLWGHQEMAIDLEGGRLWVSWRPGQALQQRGPSSYVFEGTVQLPVKG